MLLHLFPAGDETPIAALRCAPLVSVSAPWTDYSRGFVHVFVICSPNTAFYHISESSIEWRGSWQCAWPFWETKNGDRALLCKVISYEALAHPSEHNGAVVLVPGLATTGIDLEFLSSSVSVWEAGQYLQALISFWFSLSADSLMFSLWRQQGFDVRQMSHLEEGLQKQTRWDETDVLICKY